MDKNAIRKSLLHQAITLKVPVLQGEALNVLLELIEKEHVKRFLEIGSAIGKTAIEIALENPDVHITSIERDEQMAALARKNIEEAGLSNRITLIEADALLPDLVDGLFDGIFIDGAKSKYLDFFRIYAPHLKPDGFIFSDNLDFHGMVDHPERTSNRHTKGLIKKLKVYREFLQNHPDYETRMLSIGDGIALTRRKPTC